MKTTIAVIALTLLVAGNAGAWEFQRNPDRFPSVGLDFANSYASGDRNEKDLPNTSLSRTQTGSERNYGYEVGGDLRLPVTDSITVSGFYHRLTEDAHFTREGGVYKEDNLSKGYRYGLSVRVYLNK